MAYRPTTSEKVNDSKYPNKQITISQIHIYVNINITYDLLYDNRIYLAIN